MNKCVLTDYASKENGEAKILERVGINDFKQYRVDFSDRAVLTRQAAYVDLRQQNGAHMSRLVEVLQTYEDQKIDHANDILLALKHSHGSLTAYWQCKWNTAHIMENEQLLFVSCGLEGNHKSRAHWYLTVEVPYASVCPCSHEMVTEAGSGIPHMQRALAKVTGELYHDDDLNEVLTSTVAAVIGAVGLVPTPHMKRPDELDWCQGAAEHNLFVEDAARRIGIAMDAFYKDYVVVCEHFESIHQHNVTAVCRAGRRLL